jgi:hypothetical protein
MPCSGSGSSGPSQQRVCTLNGRRSKPTRPLLHDCLARHTQGGHVQQLTTHIMTCRCRHGTGLPGAAVWAAPPDHAPAASSCNANLRRALRQPAVLTAAPRHSPIHRYLVLPSNTQNAAYCRPDWAMVPSRLTDCDQQCQFQLDSSQPPSQPYRQAAIVSPYTYIPVAKTQTTEHTR